MSTPRQPLYQRLPEIYRIKDAEQFPPGQLKAWLAPMEELLGGMRDNIEALYHDFFIETCSDWVIPYLADALGTSHLSGDPWTLRADVARTVFHRRRKGTLGAIESLTFSLSGWAAQAVEMRTRLVWNQHLNHQRPDEGGQPPLRFRDDISSAVRGGTVTLRDPALLTFLGGPFDPFAHVADFKPLVTGAPRHNLPVVAVFVWRLEDYLVPVADPSLVEVEAIVPPAAGDAGAVVRCILHPQADPMILFNTHRYDPDAEPPELSLPDAVPGPMPWPRLTTESPHGNPSAYVRVDHYAGPVPAAPGAGSPGLVLHLPPALQPPAGRNWQFRGANLCAWEDGLRPPLREYEIAIDPWRGRVLVGFPDPAPAALPSPDSIFASYTYGFAGPTGAHPVSRSETPAMWNDEAVTVVSINRQTSAQPLADALANLQDRTTPLVIEIQDSATYDLDLATVSGVENQAGILSLRLSHSLWIRAASGQRPVIRLATPLRFRPHDVLSAGAEDVIATLQVRLEGLYVTRDRAAFTGGGLIGRAALNRLVIEGCTLDPGGAWQLNDTELGTRQAMQRGLELANDYGFDDASEETAFEEVPVIEITRSIVGAIAADDGYELAITDSIVDAGSGLEDTPPALAVGSLTDPANGWGPGLTVSGMTCFGAMHVERVTGQGGIWVHRLEAHDNQAGCVRFSYFSGAGDRLPPHHGCVFAPEADLSFAAEWFGLPGYGQIQRRCERRILEEGPGRDEMGAFGYLLNTHKWKNINIRYREFMAVGLRPLLIPVT
jgi:hypothetical protein